MLDSPLFGCLRRLFDYDRRDEASLYDRRDLMPTSDVRDWAAQAMAGLFGLDRGLLEGTVFPGLKMEAAPGLIL